MGVLNLITVVEADEYNEASDDWLALTAPEKSTHIFKASLYMQRYWSCVAIDWTDTTTMTDDLKMACAYYAEADRLNLLFSPVSAVERTGRITEITGKVGPLLETTRWSTFGAIESGNPLSSIDALMLGECTRLSPGWLGLVRV